MNSGSSGRDGNVREWQEFGDFNDKARRIPSFRFYFAGENCDVCNCFSNCCVLVVIKKNKERRGSQKKEIV